MHREELVTIYHADTYSLKESCPNCGAEPFQPCSELVSVNLPIGKELYNKIHKARNDKAIAKRCSGTKNKAVEGLNGYLA
jgi:hypothetical protein